jgi:hypothetical protein
MNRVLQWMRKLRLARRDKRVALLGGFPEPIPDAEVTRFEPDLHEAERLKYILDRISTLGAESFDEATGDPLDDSVNLQAEECRFDLNQQHLAFLGTADQRLAEASAVAQQYRLLHDIDLTRLQTAELALETAILALSGREPVEVSDSRMVRPGTAAGLAEPIVISVVPEAEEAAADAARTGQAAAAEQEASSAVQAARPGADEPDWLNGRAASPTARVSRREFGKLLAPQDASRVPKWGEPGFRDGTLLAGRPYGTYLHVLALVLAAAADIGAFVQVVELVLPNQSDQVIWMVITGLTVVVLYIAHTIGVLLREARAREPGTRGLARISSRLGQRAAIVLCAAVWLAVGLMAFWVRKTVPLPITPTLGGGGIGTGGASAGIGIGGIGTSAAATSTASTAHTLQGAAIFLSLYLATGVVAAAGAYFSHNPYRGRYAAAIRAYQKASERAAASAYQLGQAVARYRHQQRSIASAEQVLKDAQKRNLAYAERLKQRVRVEIAGLAKDPAVTDAIFGPDHRPYWQTGKQP